MADKDTTATAPAKPAVTDAEAERNKIIAAYHDALTREAKGALVAKHPWLGQIFAAINHSN